MIENLRFGLSPVARATSRPSSPLSGTRLSTSPFLSPGELHALEGIVSPARSVRRGTDLIGEGERPDQLLIIARGWACRSTTTPRGDRQYPALLVPGDIGNLDSLLLDRLDYDVRTLTDALVTAMPRDRVLALIAEHPGIARTFTWLALVENVTLSKLTLSLGRRSARERLAHLLCELSARLGGEVGDESSFSYPLTQEHLADALGLTPVHVNRVMQRLRAEGVIATGLRTMTVPDMGRLREIGGFDPAYLHLRSPQDA
ncbi:Crp/Fnr family transcriptional regulator [uncultured Sphingomonas sp.]|uniref:Crp/Fnr family transcriptional regulator n=1 Tax=uncultured Sphingomonas sp. TaxID=158754 RepID=UPI0035CB6C11